MSASSKREVRDERRARLAEVQAEQKRAERRRTWVVVGVAAAVVLALVVPAALFVGGELRRQQEVQAAAERPIDGVEEIEITSSAHVTTGVQYDRSPAAGGDHHPVWQNCGFYDEPVVEDHAVHSLEHGAVWLAYDPSLPQGDVDALEALTRRHPYLLVSPYEGVGSPVVASAWGAQLRLDGVDDERLEPFLLRYLQGPQTPEPGAACHGGIGA